MTHWLGTEGTLVRVASARGFEAGHWAELTDDRDELQGEPGRLARVVTVEGNTLTIETAPAWSSALKNPKLRRSDQEVQEQRLEQKSMRFNAHPCAADSPPRVR